MEHKSIKGDEIRKRKKSNIFVATVTIILLALIVWLIFLLKGKTTTSGDFPANIKTRSIVCGKDNAQYAYVGASESSKNTFRVIGVFNESKRLQKINFDYYVHFEDNDSAVAGESYIHHLFAKSLESNGLKYSELNNKFSVLNSKVDISLYATPDIINEYNAQYLLIKTHSEASDFSLTEDDFEHNYQSQGFICESTNEN